MYNIAITKDKETKFYDGADGKPRPYPTLADALVSAQYLGLTRQDVELHFVKEGASTEAITQTTTAMAKPKTSKTKDKPAVLEQSGGSKPLEEMNHDELAACAKELNIDLNPSAKDDEIRVAIQTAKELDSKTQTETPLETGVSGSDAATTPADGTGGSTPQS